LRPGLAWAVQVRGHQSGRQSKGQVEALLPENAE